MNDGKITIESLVKIINGGFEGLEKRMATKDDIAAIRGEMATKQDLADVFANMATKEDINYLREDIEKLPTRAEMIEEISKFKYAKEIDEMRGWMHRMKKKLG